MVAAGRGGRVLGRAKSHDAVLPRARENENKCQPPPCGSLNGVIQIFLIVSFFAEYAFTMALKMTSAP